MPWGGGFRNQVCDFGMLVARLFRGTLERTHAMASFACLARSVVISPYRGLPLLRFGLPCGSVLAASSMVW